MVRELKIVFLQTTDNTEEKEKKKKEKMDLLKCEKSSKHLQISWTKILVLDIMKFL